MKEAAELDHDGVHAEEDVRDEGVAYDGEEVVEVLHAASAAGAIHAEDDDVSIEGEGAANANGVHHATFLHCEDAVKEVEATEMIVVEVVPVHSACCRGAVSILDDHLLLHHLEVHIASYHQQGKADDSLNLPCWSQYRR